VHSARSKLIRSNWQKRAAPVFVGGQTLVSVVVATIFVCIVVDNDETVRWKVCFVVRCRARALS